MKKLNKKIIILLFIFIILSNLTYLAGNIKIDTPPDEESVVFFSSNLIENSKISWKSDLDETHNISAFRPRGAIKMEGEYFPLVSVYYVYFFAIGRILLDNYFPLIINFITLISFLFFYLLSNEILENKNDALLATGIYSIFPAILVYTNSLFDIFPAITFFIISFYYFLKFIKKEKYASLFLSALFFITGLMIRFTNIFLIIFYLWIFIYKKKYKKIFNKKGILILFSTIFILFIFLGTNLFTYGDFLHNGRTDLAANTLDQDQNSELFYDSFKTVIINSNFDGIKYLITNYIMPYSFLFIFIIFSGIYLLFQNKNIKKYLIGSFFLSFLFFIIFYSSNTTGNIPISLTQTLVRSSISRHLLPIYMMGIIFFPIFFKKLSGKKIKIITIFLIICLLNNFLFITQAGMGDILERENKLKIISDEMAQIEENSIIIVKKLSYINTDYSKTTLLVFTKEDFKNAPIYNYIYEDLSNEKIIQIIKTEIQNRNIYLIKEGTTTYNILNEHFLLKRLNKSSIYKIEK